MKEDITKLQEEVRVLQIAPSTTLGKGVSPYGSTPGAGSMFLNKPVAPVPYNRSQFPTNQLPRDEVGVRRWAAPSNMAPASGTGFAPPMGNLGALPYGYGFNPTMGLIPNYLTTPQLQSSTSVQSRLGGYTPPERNTRKPPLGTNHSMTKPAAPAFQMGRNAGTRPERVPERAPVRPVAQVPRATDPVENDSSGAALLNKMRVGHCIVMMGRHDGVEELEDADERKVEVERAPPNDQRFRMRGRDGDEYQRPPPMDDQIDPRYPVAPRRGRPGLRRLRNPYRRRDGGMQNPRDPHAVVVPQHQQRGAARPGQIDDLLTFLKGQHELNPPWYNDHHYQAIPDFNWRVEQWRSLQKGKRRRNFAVKLTVRNVIYFSEKLRRWIVEVHPSHNELTTVIKEAMLDSIYDDFYNSLAAGQVEDRWTSIIDWVWMSYTSIDEIESKYRELMQIRQGGKSPRKYSLEIKTKAANYSNAFTSFGAIHPRKIIHCN